MTISQDMLFLTEEEFQILFQAQDLIKMARLRAGHVHSFKSALDENLLTLLEHDLDTFVKSAGLEVHKNIEEIDDNEQE